MSLVARLQAELQEIPAPFVKRLNLRVVEAGEDTVVIAMPVTPDLVHSGGVLCGQATLALADTAMLVGMSAALGGFRMMTTVQLQTSFIRPVPPDAAEVRATCRILRRGKSLSFGEIGIATPDGKLAAHATTTYALI